MSSFPCDVPGCTKIYRSKINLKRHKQAIHATIKKYQCNICSKALSSNQNLQEHQLIHSTIQPFVCKDLGCGKRFRHGSQFSAHKRIHNLINSIVLIPTALPNTKFFTALLTLSSLNPPNPVNLEKPSSKILLPKIGELQSFSLPSL